MNRNEMLEKFDVLRNEYIKLINDKDVLINWGKPQLEALYNTRIGVHQVALLQLQLSVHALKRKVEMVRSLVARKQPVDIDEVEQLVQAELEKAQLSIMHQLNDIELSKVLLNNLESPTRSAELRSLFRQMAKQLHPDIIGHLSAEQQNLWTMVKDAYDRGDVEKLRTLQIIYQKELSQGQATIEQYSTEELSLRMEIIKEGIKLLYEEIDLIKKEFPFTMETKIKDEEWVKAETEKIQTETHALRSYEGELILEYQELVNVYGGAKSEHN